MILLRRTNQAMNIISGLFKTKGYDCTTRSGMVKVQ